MGAQAASYDICELKLQATISVDSKWTLLHAAARCKLLLFDAALHACELLLHVCEASRCKLRYLWTLSGLCYMPLHAASYYCSMVLVFIGLKKNALVA